MAAGEVHENDVGTVFRVTVKDEDGAIVDISAATVRKISFKLNALAKVEQTAVLTGTGTDGQMEYVSVAGDLTPKGKLKYQGYVEFADGSHFNSDILEEIIHPNLT